MNNIIIGAGFTGLSAGINTGFEIYERSDAPGGICRSYYACGFRFENGGGHWIFGADDEILNFLRRYSDLKGYERKSSVYIQNKFDYPIQAALNEQEPSIPGSMKHDLRQKFGNTLNNIFFSPFNRKYTQGLYETVLLEHPEKSPTKGKGYNTKFYYPIGGLDKLADRMADPLNIHYNKTVDRIDTKKKFVKFTDGSEVNYNNLISTMPLTVLLRKCGIDIPKITKQANSMPSTSVFVMNVGCEVGLDMPEDHWIYIPFSKSDFYRVGFYSNVDQSFAPEGKASLYCEMSFVGEPNMDNLMTNANVFLDELRSRGWIGKIDVVRTDIIRPAYTWVFPHTQINECLDYLKTLGIHSTGRYGKWRFQGISESIRDGWSINV